MRGFDLVEPGVWRDPRSGNVYTSVSYRTRKFREKHPNYGVNFIEVPYGGPDQFKDDPRGRFIKMRCEISDETGRLIAVGHAEEDRKFGPVNKTSAIENAETSALGRALACLGFLSDQYASAEEIERARATERNMKRYEEGDHPAAPEERQRDYDRRQAKQRVGFRDNPDADAAVMSRSEEFSQDVGNDPHVAGRNGPVDPPAVPVATREEVANGPPSKERLFVDLLAAAQTVDSADALRAIMDRIRSARDGLSPGQLDQLRPAVLAARAAFGGA
ncbi:MAG: hypothetical protein Unbinned3992contig1000_24 [Prokaryotic dsDNA virus sp.]|nr:MAG: hypothetical protein Unbinned3992contig1000_24 [Prokaryotic dsDNA virus sp.]|tara:strand:+ start:8262 stop:9086 length:825 start_codon:yes stop_codon:yes gene_type:complete